MHWSSLVICFFFVLISCQPRHSSYDDSDRTEIEEESDQLEALRPDQFEILEIEGCEYLIFQHTAGTHGFGYMTHKGNCTNPIHCYREVDTLQ